MDKGRVSILVYYFKNIQTKNCQDYNLMLNNKFNEGMTTF